MPEKKPTRTADLDYFYGQSSELFSFYRIPKLLFQDSRFQPLSTDAKTLYGILLDRMSLSARNGWLDKAGRVFIIYTMQEVQDSLGCADKKATKLLRELEEYGLIERKRRGLGKPDLIYVKNFSSESSKLRFLNRDNDDSGVVQNTLQDPAKLRCNKTDRNNTEVSDTDPIYSDENDWMSKRAQLEEYFSRSLEMKRLVRQNRGVTNVEIQKTGIKDFDRYAKRYHIDYSIQKDLSCKPPRYLIYFKAQDTDALNAAFKEYSASVLDKTKRPSVLAKLHDLAQSVANLPDKVRHKQEERGL